MTLRVTRKIVTNAQIELKVESQITEVAGNRVGLSTPAAGGNAPAKILVPAPGFNTHTLQMTVAVPDAGTVVIRSPKPDSEILWVLTAHIVRNDKKGAAPEVPAPIPVPVVPTARP